MTGRRSPFAPTTRPCSTPVSEVAPGARPDDERERGIRDMRADFALTDDATLFRTTRPHLDGQ